MSLALIAVIAFGAAAYGATVRAVQGQVLVDAGQGYRLVDGSTQLDPGGTVVANPGQSQKLCMPAAAVTVQPGSVYLVAGQPPCRTGGPTKTGGLPGDKGGPSEDKGGPSESTGGSSMGSGTAWALGAVAVVGGGAAAYFLIPPLSP
jgi:hypothetical protein